MCQSELVEDLYARLMVRQAHHDRERKCQSELVEDLYARLMVRQAHHDNSVFNKNSDGFYIHCYQ